jgi:outer membrane protein assembly factor BamB
LPLLLVGVVITAALGGELALAQDRPANVQNPRRIAAGLAGQLLVADRSSGSVIAVDKASLEPRWSFQLPDEGAPFGLASWKRMVFIGNTETENVEVYQMVGSRRAGRELRFRFNLGHTQPGEPGLIAKPVSIAVDQVERRVFALDAREKKILIFDRAGALLDSFTPADAGGVVLSPVSIAVDTQRQELLVSDFGDPSGSFSAAEPARILIYDYSGQLLFVIDGDGGTHESTQFARIQGVEISADGRIFAADPLAGRILILDRSSGALLGQVGNEGSEPGELMLPLDVYIDSTTGDLFVSNNRGARRIEVFREAGS